MAKSINWVIELKVSILGAGHGGYAMYADLSMAGHEVNLYELPEFAENIKPIIDKGGIDIIARRPPNEEFQLPAGGQTGFAKITGRITSDVKEALDDVDLIMLVVPAFARERFIKKIASYLRDGQVLVIWPAYFGALQCVETLKKMNVNRDIVVAETESLIYACRKIGPAQVLIEDFKRKLLISAFPAEKTGEVLSIMKEIYPQLVSARNVLETTLSNINPILHPASILVNLYRVEAKFYPFYEEIGGPFCRCYDITPGIARVMEAIDRERLNIAKQLGMKLLSLKETLTAFYSAYGRNLYETILNVPAYQKQLAPTSLRHRFIVEDVPYGLVPYSQLGNHINVQTPTTNALIRIASVVCDRNFWSESLVLDEIGLTNMTAEEMLEYVTKGSTS